MSAELRASIRSFERKQMTVSLLGLMVLVCAAVILNYVHMRSVAEQSGKFISRMIQLRDFREVAITLQEARLDRFHSIRYDSVEKARSFTLPESAELLGEQGLLDRLLYDNISIRARDPQGADSQDFITFQYNRFQMVPWALLFWFLLNLVSIPPTRIIKKRIVAQFERDLLVQKELVRADLARKVRHNIRTPLSALLRLSGSAKGLNQEEGELFQSIIEQVRALISELDERPSREHGVGEALGSLYDCIRTSVQEIRLASPPRISIVSQIQDSVASALVRFDACEMRSILANIANNAFEAITGEGSVFVDVEDRGHEVLVQVRDTGPGISQELVSRVTEKGFTHGKRHGTGLGLWHANEFIKRWSGRIEISSSPRGTTISIYLQISERATWYTPRVKLSNSDTVVIIDDQIATHRLWKMRLDEAGFTGTSFFYFSANDLPNALAYLAFDQVVVFADYDLGTEEFDGIQLLEALPQSARRYLVTGHFDHPEIQSKCANHNIGLIPKTELAEMPLLLVR